MKFTLLQMTQSILSSLNSDEVNSIGDTPEALQVAECIRTSYLNMMGRYDLPQHNQLFQLSPSNTQTMPTLMYIPQGINRVEWIKYFDTNPLDSQSVDQFGAFSHGLNLDIIPTNPFVTSSTSSVTIGTGLKTFTVASGLGINAGQGAQAIFNTSNFMAGTVQSYVASTLVLNITQTGGSGTYNSWTIQGSGGISGPPGYKEVCLLTPEQFIDYTSSFNIGDGDVQSFTLDVGNFSTLAQSNFTFNYKNDFQPKHYCIISNYYVIFDSYDSTQDSTLQSSKTMCMGWVMPQFLMQDNFVPNLEEQLTPMLLNEAKSLAFYEIKGQSHAKAEHEVMRQLSSLQKFKAIAHRPTPFEQLPSFGRAIGTGGYAVGYPQRY